MNLNKTIAVLASLAVMGSAVECLAAAIVSLNNYDVNIPIMYQGPQLVSAPTTTYVQLLAGPVGGLLSPVTINATTGSIIEGIDDGGFFDAGLGVIHGVTDYAQADFLLRAWIGAATFEAATVSGQSAKWTQATGSWDLTSPTPGKPDSVVLNLPASGLVIGKWDDSPTFPPPFAAEYQIGAWRDRTYTLGVAELVRACSYFDGPPIRLSDVGATSAAGGTVVLSGDRITYTPPAGYTGTDTFKYTVDNGWESNQGIVIVTVLAPESHGPNFLGITTGINTVTLRLLGIAKQVYQIEASTNLLNWVKLGQGTAGADGFFEFTDGDKNLYPCRYYRSTL